MTPVAVDVNDAAAVGESLAAATADAVVLTVRTVPADEEFLVAATRTVLDAAARLGIRVLVIGGAGALRSPGAPDLPVADNPVYVAAEYRAVAAVGVAQLRTCVAHSGADWVYLSPPALLEPGARTGRYRRGTDTLLLGPDGESRISAEDLAVAVLDELESPGAERHFTVTRQHWGGIRGTGRPATTGPRTDDTPSRSNQRKETAPPEYGGGLLTPGQDAHPTSTPA